MRVSTQFVVAGIPAALAGALALGALVDPAAPAAADFWQLRLIATAGDAGWARALALGLAFLLPQVAVALAVSLLWAGAFARMRGRPLDAGWYASAVLFALLLPAATPPAYAALALSFGLVFGCHALGGSGRQIVTAPVLAIVFLQTAYPPLFESGQWLPGLAVDSGWAELHSAAAAGSAGPGFGQLLLGREAGALGAPSALACLAGLGLLLWRGTAAGAIVIGALAAAAGVALLLDPAIGLRHLVVGNFMLAVALFATDPAVRPATLGGRAAFGVLLGALTVVIRKADPAGPEGTWHALLLASLCVPLLDRVAAAAGRRLAQRGAAPQTERAG